MIINNNLSAMNALRHTKTNTNALAKSMEKLSSGLRINRGADDAAGLSISEKMRGQIRGLEQASQNSQEGISLIQTADGALNETHAILQRMRELSVQAANGTNTSDEKNAIQAEISELIDEVDRIANNTEFNKMTLLDGSLKESQGHCGKNGGIDIQVGANAGQTIRINIDDMTSKGLSISGVSVTSQNGADKAITTIDDAITTVSKQRSQLGAKQNRLEHTITNLDNTAENLQAAESRIRDTDMAKEMVELTKASIITQSSQAMLAHANQTPQHVLALLR